MSWIIKPEGLIELAHYDKLEETRKSAWWARILALGAISVNILAVAFGMWWQAYHPQDANVTNIPSVSVIETPPVKFDGSQPVQIIDSPPVKVSVNNIPSVKIKDDLPVKVNVTKSTPVNIVDDPPIEVDTGQNEKGR